MQSKTSIHLLLAFLFLAGSNIFGGETGKIAGRVVDKSTNEALVGATVIVIAKLTEEGEEPLVRPLGASTDTKGNFVILAVPGGTYLIKCTYIGYQDEIRRDVKVAIDRTTRIDFALSLRTQVTDEVIITAYSQKKVEADLTATKQTYDVDNVKEIAGVQDVGDILALQPDIIDDHFRGGRLGQSNYLISGTSIVNPLSNQRAFSPIVTGLKTVEVLTSGFSAEYGNAQSGVVNMVAKEGGDSWKTMLDFSGNAPFYKTWNGNPYSESNLKFANLLYNIEEWKNDNKVNAGKPNWDLGNNFSSYYYNAEKDPDSMLVSRLVQVFWMQSAREIGMEYNNTVDSRVDFSISGPLSEDTRLFVAGRHRATYPLVPTNDPDIARQIMGNITYQPDEANKFGFRFIWDNSFENVFSKSSWQRFLFNRILSVAKNTQQTFQFGFDWKYILTSSSVFDAKLTVMDVITKNRLELMNTGEFTDIYTNRSNWVNYYSPANFYNGALADDKGTDKVRTYDFHGSFNVQVNEGNLLKAGVQVVYNNLNVNRDMNITNQSAYRKILFNVFPFEGGIYLQDKMEFEGFIANVGLRFDFYDMNTQYYTNIYSPLKNPYYDETKPLGQRGNYYDAKLALKDDTKPYTRLQPRIGLSFPVTESSVFHINYGTFTQRPSFEQIFYSQVTQLGDIEILGNPNLKPENTKMYDIGIVNAFPFGLKLDISAYYKDVKDLVEQAYYFDKQQTVYRSFANRDYSDIKGFFITMEQFDDNMEFFARYNFEAATGKASTSFDAPITYYEEPPAGQSAVKLPAPEDIYMNYDRTHKLVGNFRYKFLNNEGPELLGVHPLENFSFSVTMRIFSGRPYTFDLSGQGLRYNKRTPAEYDLRARLQKAVRLTGVNLNFYLEAYNLLNTKIYSYGYMFENDLNVTRYEQDFANIENYVQYAPYITSQAIPMYSNTPRNFRLGMIATF